MAAFFADNDEIIVCKRPGGEEFGEFVLGEEAPTEIVRFVEAFFVLSDGGKLPRGGLFATGDDGDHG